MLRKLWKQFAARQGRTDKRRKKSPTFRPCLEQLEKRVVPVTNAIWIGPTGGAWNTAANWSTGAVPDSNTDVYLGSIYPGGNNDASVVNPNITVDSVTASTSYGGLTVQNCTLSATGTIDLYGSTLITGSLTPTEISAASINVYGSAAMTSIGMSNTLSANTINLEAGGSITVTANSMAPATLSATDGLAVSGDLSITASSDLSISVPAGGATVYASGTVQIADGASLSYTGFQTFEMGGTLTASAPASGLPAGVGLSVSPSVTIGGTLNVDSGASLTVSGTLDDQGNVNLLSATAAMKVSGDMDINANLDLYAPAPSMGMPGAPTLTVTGLVDIGSGANLWVYGVSTVPVGVISAGSHSGNFANINGQSNSDGSVGSWSGGTYVYTG